MVALILAAACGAEDGSDTIADDFGGIPECASDLDCRDGEICVRTGDERLDWACVPDGAGGSGG